MIANMADIAHEFGLSEEELTAEALRTFLKEHLRQLETKLRSCCAQAGVDSIQGLERLLRQGNIGEADLQAAQALAERAHRLEMLLQDLPLPANPPPTLEQVREILQTKTLDWAESYGIKILGIYGPYAAGKPRPYDRIGLLVELLKPMGIEFFGLEGELGKILGAPVQVSTRGGLWPDRSEQIMSELVRI